MPNHKERIRQYMNGMEVNLISDTVTKPTPEMLEAMMTATVGDDVFGEDPTVNALQEKVARIFGHEASLFCPSGTMTNQIALQLHLHALEEVICEENSHIYQFETGGYAYNARAAINLIQGRYGKLTSQQVKSALKATYDWLPKSKLLSIENSCNKGGGTYYTLTEARTLQELCRNHHLRFHLDGARLFNVLVETGDQARAWGELFDTISICLSKGLGAPVGSLLVSSKENIDMARRFRKVMGGGMRQAGILAAAGIYALDHHVDRLKEDNNRAKAIGKALEAKSFVTGVRPVQTNIVIADLVEDYPAEHFIEHLKHKGVRAVSMGSHAIRFVTHLNLTDAMIDHTLEVIHGLVPV